MEGEFLQTQAPDYRKVSGLDKRSQLGPKLVVRMSGLQMKEGQVGEFRFGFVILVKSLCLYERGM